MNKLFLKAPAKLNLHLQVIDKRSDGFHNISSFFTLISLYDEINIKLISNQIVLKEEKPIENNLVLKAANLLKYISGTKKGAEIELLKRILLVVFGIRESMQRQLLWALTIFGI